MELSADSVSYMRIVELAEQGEQQLHLLIFTALQFFKTMRDVGANAQSLQRDLPSQLNQEKDNYVESARNLQSLISQLMSALNQINQPALNDKSPDINPELIEKRNKLKVEAYEKKKNEIIKTMIDKFRKLQFDMNVMVTMDNIEES